MVSDPKSVSPSARESVDIIDRAKTHRAELKVPERHDEGFALAQPEGGLERAQAQRDVNEERVFAVVDHDDGRRDVVVQQPK